MKVRLTPAARADLRAIYREGVRLFGQVQAARYIAVLEQALRFIGDFPLAVRLRPEFNPPLRVHPVSAHIIVFDVAQGEVIVVRIRHGREDWDSRS